MPGSAKHRALPFLRSPEKGKVVTAPEAVKLIRDGDTVATSGFVGIGFAEEIGIAPLARKLVDRFYSGVSRITNPRIFRA
jgi:acyl-CoA hydrolase